MKNVQHTLKRNFYMLRGRYKRNGYDRWRHFFTGYNKLTGQKKSFFIEYVVINPALYPDKVSFAQRHDNQLNNVRPSYVMVKAGAWGVNPKQINNFYPAQDLVVKSKRLDIQVGSCSFSEFGLAGIVHVDESEARQYPERMSNAGSMEWNLKMQKKIVYSADYFSSPVLNFFRIFDTYWYVSGAKTEFQGSVQLDGEEYDVVSEDSCGYTDKNWGRSYLDHCLFLNCTHMTSLFTGRKLENSCLVLGGGTQRLFSVNLNKNALVYLNIEGEIFEFNFFKFWEKNNVTYSFRAEKEQLYWSATAQNRQLLMDISLFAKKETALTLHYEAPNGKKMHNNFWAAGDAWGEIKLFRKRGKALENLEHISLSNAFCQYGEYDVENTTQKKID